MRFCVLLCCVLFFASPALGQTEQTKNELGLVTLQRGFFGVWLVKGGQKFSVGFNGMNAPLVFQGSAGYQQAVLYKETRVAHFAMTLVVSGFSLASLLFFIPDVRNYFKLQDGMEMNILYGALALGSILNLGGSLLLFKARRHLQKAVYLHNREVIQKLRKSKSKKTPPKNVKLLLAKLAL